MKTTRILAILVLALGLATEVANADFTFGTPTNLGPIVNSSAGDWAPSISSDGLSLFIISNRPGGYGNLDIWVTTRATTDDPWGTPVNLGPTINSPVAIWGVSISSDGLSLYFDRGDAGDIWLTTRATTEDPWGTPVHLGPTVNSLRDDSVPNISADDLSLYFNSRRPGGHGNSDLWVTRRETTDKPWGAPVNLGPSINSSALDISPSISADGRTFFFASERSGGYGQTDIWVTRRATTDDPWGEPVNLGSTVNSSTWDDFPNVSADGSTLFFRVNQFGLGVGGDIWQAPIVPVVDFNGDGIVDSADMCIMVDHWGEYYPLCDIGPTPLGDGIVDVEDLIVLAEHLFEDVNDPTLVAHWALDDIEGDIAYDSVAVNDAVVFGDAVWQPAGGQIDGALAFDGTDDYVSTPFVLNPADGPFSVFAWIKEGAPGQVVLSQIGGANWLSADSLEGNLMTQLKTLGRGGNVPIVSETVITDGNWHRIGFVWDGSYRYLYVDGAEVAKDTASFSMLESSDGGLYLGAGSTLDAGSFFSGLIDDVRIYNRAITP